MKTTEVLSELKRRFPNEPEYHQAVEEVLSTIEDVYNEHPEFDRYNLIERLCIPYRMFSFRVTCVDDKGQVHTNMGYRIQHNNAIGPYKGGIRFHSSVNPSILKFLAFEQTFKIVLFSFLSISTQPKLKSHGYGTFFFISSLPPLSDAFRGYAILSSLPVFSRASGFCEAGPEGRSVLLPCGVLRRKHTTHFRFPRRQ